MKQKRRRFSAEFKFAAVMELLRGEKGPAQICRERQIKDSLLYQWRDAFLARAPGVFEDRRPQTQPGEAERIAELERMVGRLALENDILKKADSLLGEMRRKNGQ